MNELTKRTISGTIFVAVIVGILVWGPQYFDLFAGLIAMLGVYEFHRLRGDTEHSPSVFLSAATAVCLVYSLPYGIGSIQMNIYGILLVTVLLIELWRKAEDPIRNWGNVLIAQIMIALPFALMVKIAEISNILMLAVFVIIWTNDTFAYCTGSLLSKRKGGNHKMFERVSPKKSWEGLIGGFLFALVAGYIFSIFETQFAVWQWIVVAALISVFGTLGDLMESLMKRTIGVKDSGKFLPGHGGVLDRFDSILLATPLVYIVLTTISHLA